VRSLLLNLALSTGSFFFLILVIEAVARLIAGNWTQSFLEKKVDLMKSAYPVEHDPAVGWIPRPGFSGSKNVWHTQVSITPDGIRSNGPPGAPLSGRPILALGDSYTFGDETSDAESWPAHLERSTRRPVWNAGVFGYGIDQMVLRARQLVPKVKPEWVVLSFIPDDINRCELSMRGAHKPYFRLVDGALKLENQPVSPPEPVQMDRFRRVFGYSWIVHTVMKNVAQRYWYEGRGKQIKVHDDGEKVAAALLRTFAGELAKQNVRLLIVAQADSRLLPVQQAQAAEVLAAQKGSPARLLDLHPPLAALREADAKKFQSYFHGHMTSDGNRYVAEKIVEQIR
jgi:hypothetical protein